MKKKPKSKKIAQRNWTAVSAWFQSGGGKHHNRTKAVSKGQSRKVKHKGLKDYG